VPKTAISSQCNADALQNFTAPLVTGDGLETAAVSVTATPWETELDDKESVVVVLAAPYEREVRAHAVQTPSQTRRASPDADLPATKLRSVRKEGPPFVKPTEQITQVEQTPVNIPVALGAHNGYWTQMYIG